MRRLSQRENKCQRRQICLKMSKVSDHQTQRGSRQTLEVLHFCSILQYIFLPAFTFQISGMFRLSCSFRFLTQVSFWNCKASEVAVLTSPHSSCYPLLRTRVTFLFKRFPVWWSGVTGLHLNPYYTVHQRNCRTKMCFLKQVECKFMPLIFTQKASRVRTACWLYITVKFLRFVNSLE